MLLTTRKERRALEAENRTYPAMLVEVPRAQWEHLNSRVQGGAKRTEVWRSRHFLLQVFAERDAIERLTISRTTLKGDRWADEISWDDLQRLKSECGRGDRDAVEIYPTDGDVVNVANMRHMWVLPVELPFKWKVDLGRPVPPHGSGP